MIELPKPDKRYKVGKIVKNKKGEYRGHPLTVIPKRMEILQSTYNSNIALALNPPLVVSHELAQWMETQDEQPH